MPIVVANILFGQRSTRTVTAFYQSSTRANFTEILGISKHCIFRQKLLRVHTTKKISIPRFDLMDLAQ